MKQLLTHFRTFFETWFGECDVWVNTRGKVSARITLFWFEPREVDLPTESIQQSKFIPVRIYTPPAQVTRIHYVLPATQSEQNFNTPTVHIPIRPLAPSS